MALTAWGDTRVLQFADILVGRSNQSGCRRCHGANPEEFADSALVADAIQAAVGSWQTGAGRNIAFTGAEPLGHPELTDLVRLAAEAGAERIRLDSDGSGLRDESTARALLQAGVRHVCFSLLGSEPALHDALVAREGAFAAALDGVATFGRVARELGVTVNVTARLPICRHNVQDAPDLVASAVAAGATSVAIALVDEGLDPFSAAPWIEAACDTGVVHACWVDVEGVPFEAAVGWELHLASIYRRVRGAKSAACAACPLDAHCSGAPAGAPGQLTGRLSPPADADRLADRIASTYAAPGPRRSDA